MGYNSIDELLANYSYTKVRIQFNDTLIPSSAPVIGYMIDETFNLDASTQWATPLDNMELGNLFGQQFGAILGAITDVFGFSRKIVEQTVAFWQGPERPEFSVGLLFLARNSNDHPELRAAEILKRIHPGMNKGKGSVMDAPMGYMPLVSGDTNVQSFVQFISGADPGRGMSSLSIGNWFQANNLLLKNASFEASRECTKGGSPLYVQGKVSFDTARAVSNIEYGNMFSLGTGEGNLNKRPNPNPTSTLSPMTDQQRQNLAYLTDPSNY